MASGDSPFPEVPHVRASYRPVLDRPVLIAAFEGWNDAGDAATLALGHLMEEWGVQPFGEIDAEEFHDFTSSRPMVSFDDEGARTIDWPSHELGSARVRPDLHVVTLLATEPQLRWRTYCSQITGLARAFDARLVVTLGALLGEVPHTRPTPVYGVTYDETLTEGLNLLPSSYEGPTGIVGVVHDALNRHGLPSASLWAAVPTYVPNAPSPKAALALVERAAQLLQTPTDISELEQGAQEYVGRLDEIVASDEETAEFVARLEEAYDATEEFVADGSSLVEEVERFLRDQPDR